MSPLSNPSAMPTIDNWLVDIIGCLSEPSTSIGTWALLDFSPETPYPFGGVSMSSGGAQNDEIAWDVALSAGTWSIMLHSRKSSNVGIYTVSIDGTSVGTIDGYAAAPAFAKQTLAGVVVASSGAHRLKFKMATKNASSSAYYGEIFGVSLRRTA